MISLLDTNTCIYLLNQTNPNVRRHFESRSPSEIALCSMVKAELMFGAHRSSRVDTNLQRLKLFFSPLECFAFDDRCAEHYALIRADLMAQGQPIGPNDLMIAATARANDAILVTNNIGEFSRVAGLQLEDWTI
jgi:tRNA(fMet)-specific endonuclease VapC